MQGTAKEIALGSYKTLSLLSFFNYKIGIQQTLDLKNWINKLSIETLTLLITQQVNITALTGYYPSQGEIVFAKMVKTGKITFISPIKVDNLPN